MGDLVKVAELSINKLDERKAVATVLLENGYTIGPGKRNKTSTGKTMDYYLKVYREDGEEASATK